jgi:hypothetical protein
VKQSSLCSAVACEAELSVQCCSMRSRVLYGVLLHMKQSTLCSAVKQRSLCSGGDADLSLESCEVFYRALCTLVQEIVRCRTVFRGLCVAKLYCIVYMQWWQNNLFSVLN